MDLAPRKSSEHTLMGIYTKTDICLEDLDVTVVESYNRVSRTAKWPVQGTHL